MFTRNLGRDERKITKTPSQMETQKNLTNRMKMKMTPHRKKEKNRKRGEWKEESFQQNQTMIKKDYYEDEREEIEAILAEIKSSKVHTEDHQKPKITEPLDQIENP